MVDICLLLFHVLSEFVHKKYSNRILREVVGAGGEVEAGASRCLQNLQRWCACFVLSPSLVLVFTGMLVGSARSSGSIGELARYVGRVTRSALLQGHTRLHICFELDILASIQTQDFSVCILSLRFLLLLPTCGVNLWWL